MGNIIVVMILRHPRRRAGRRPEVSVTSQAKSICSAGFISLLVKLPSWGGGGALMGGGGGL